MLTIGVMYSCIVVLCIYKCICVLDVSVYRRYSGKCRPMPSDIACDIEMRRDSFQINWFAQRVMFLFQNEALCVIVRNTSLTDIFKNVFYMHSFVICRISSRSKI